MPSIVLALLAACALDSSPTTAPALAGGARTSVLFDETAPGTILAKGGTYRATFDATAARFAPLARSHEAEVLDLRLARVEIGGRVNELAAGSPERVGNRIALDRGALVETFDLTMNEVDHGFVVDTPLGEGDLELVIDVASSLPYLGRGPDGLSFGDARGAAIRYGDLSGVDAAGRRFASASEYDGENIRLRVPGEFLAGAQYPVVLDPIISFLIVDSPAGALAATHPDVTYDKATGRYFVVYEEGAVGGAKDLVLRTFDETGSFFIEHAVDLSTTNTIDPAIASSHGEILMVWTSVGTGFLGNQIRARSFVSATGAFDNAFAVTAGSFTLGNADVGATSSDTTSHRFGVVWSDATQTSSSTVFTRMVNTTGTATTPAKMVFSSNAVETHPHISPIVDADSNLLIVARTLQNGTSSILCKAMDDDATFLTADIGLSSSSSDVLDAPDVAGDGAEFMVAWHRVAGNGLADIRMRRLRLAPVTAAVTVDPEVSLGDLGSSNSGDQRNVRLSYGSNRFLIVYENKPTLGAADPDLHADTLFVDFEFPGPAETMLESHVPIDQGQLAHDHTVCINHNKLSARDAVVVYEVTAVGGDIGLGGTLLDVSDDGGIFTIQTGCGANEPELIVTESFLAGATFQLGIENFTNPLLLVGLGATNVPLCPLQADCRLGVTPLFVVPLPNPGIVVATLPGDVGLLGLGISIQGVDLVPSGLAGPKCGPPKFTQSFRVSDTKLLIFE